MQRNLYVKNIAEIDEQRTKNRTAKILSRLASIPVTSKVRTSSGSEIAVLNLDETYSCLLCSYQSAVNAAPSLLNDLNATTFAASVVRKNNFHIYVNAHAPNTSNELRALYKCQ